jgi:hypothetical protein
MSLPLPAVRRIPLVLATVVGLLLTTGATPAKSRAAAPGDLVASPAFVALGALTAGTEGQVDVTLTNNTNKDINISDVIFNVHNAFGLASVLFTVPAHGSAQATVFMGPSTVGLAVMRVRWHGGSESSNWVLITATGT